MFEIAKSDNFRLHHPRPRFKREVEDVLIYVAREITRLGAMSTATFEMELEASLFRFPGNANKTLKTIKNWRTEIDALFGLIINEGSRSRPSQLCLQLSETGDLISFFRAFLAKFQYPGGHAKPERAAEQIERGVKFKPAQFVIRTLLSLSKLGGESAGTITKAEATYHIWNDLKVTTGLRDPDEVASRIIQARKLGSVYDEDGDKIRYAGDILDYMVLGNVLRDHPSGRYRLVLGKMEGANLILNQAGFFPEYERFYGAIPGANEIKELEEAWFVWVGDDISSVLIATDALSFLDELAAEAESGSGADVSSEMVAFLRDSVRAGSASTKDIGNTGENLVLRHENVRLVKLGALDKAKSVKKIPDHYGIGYDIKSWLDGNGGEKLIEVKTSISYGRLNDFRVHLTRNEWASASTSGDNYFIYRVLISAKDIRCFVVRNPVAQYKSSFVELSISSGADLTFTEDAGVWEQLLS